MTFYIPLFNLFLVAIICYKKNITTTWKETGSIVVSKLNSLNDNKLIEKL